MGYHSNFTRTDLLGFFRGVIGLTGEKSKCHTFRVLALGLGEMVRVLNGELIGVNWAFC